MGHSENIEPTFALAGEGASLTLNPPPPCDESPSGAETADCNSSEKESNHTAEFETTINSLTLSTLPFELILNTFQFFTLSELLHLRLISHHLKTAANTIIRRRLLSDTKIKLTLLSGSTNCTPTTSNCIPTKSTDSDICEWIGDVPFILHESWNTLGNSRTSIRVTPSQNWIYYRPFKKTGSYEKCYWTDKSTSFGLPNIYLQYPTTNGQRGTKSGFWRTGGIDSMPWTIDYIRTSRKKTLLYYTSVKLPLWALVNIYNLYLEEFQIWRDWQPWNLTSETVVEAEYYLKYFAKTLREDGEGCAKLWEEGRGFGEKDSKCLCGKLPF